MKVLGVGLVVVLAALALSASAFAGNGPAKCTYHPEKCKKAVVVSRVKVVKGAKTTSTAPVATAGTTGLPFTGADVGILLAGGVVFGLVGFGMRRSARNKHN